MHLPANSKLTNRRLPFGFRLLNRGRLIGSWWALPCPLQRLPRDRRKYRKVLDATGAADKSSNDASCSACCCKKSRKVARTSPSGRVDDPREKVRVSNREREREREKERSISTCCEIDSICSDAGSIDFFP